MSGSVTFDTAGVRPMMVVPILYDVCAATYASSLATQAACLRNGIDMRIVPIEDVRDVSEARSRAADAFLKTDATHLFFVDHDMAWRPDDAIRFMMLGTVMECLSAAYLFRREPLQFMVQMTPEFVAGEEVKVNEWGCLPFNGAGLGFTIIARSVIERLSAAAPRIRYPGSDGPIARIFGNDDVDGEYRTEDMNFFAKVQGLGVTVWLDPSIELGHIGRKEYRGRLGDLLKANPA